MSRFPQNWSQFIRCVHRLNRRGGAALDGFPVDRRLGLHCRRLVAGAVGAVHEWVGGAIDLLEREPLGDDGHVASARHFVCTSHECWVELYIPVLRHIVETGVSQRLDVAARVPVRTEDAEHFALLLIVERRLLHHRAHLVAFAGEREL